MLVMLADEDRVEAHLLGQLCLGTHLVDTLLQALAAGGIPDGSIKTERQSCERFPDLTLLDVGIVKTQSARIRI